MALRGHFFWLGLVVGLLAGCGEVGDVSQTHPGEETYNRSCFSCHAGGVAGAPIPGDAEAWAPRVAQGEAQMLESVRNGMPPGMPPMGMCTSCSDDELRAAIDFMVQQ